VSEAGRWQLNACVPWDDRLAGVYAEGYRMGALRLVQQLGQDQDFLIYPVVFLYRHYLELRLKEIIALGERLAGTNRPVRPTHDLRKLWGRAETHLRREYKDCPDHADFLADLAAARRLIEQFAELDPGATTFRYAETGKSDERAVTRPERINLGQFSWAMRTIGHFLDGASYGLSATLDMQREMEREYAPDY
jgi:hypothetical protein